MASATKRDADDQEAAFDDKAFLGDLDELSGLARSVGERTGALRAAIKEKIENRGYHSGALAMARKIRAMSETTYNDFMLSFEAMLAAVKATRANEGTASLPLDDANAVVTPIDAKKKK